MKSQSTLESMKYIKNIINFFFLDSVSRFRRICFHFGFMASDKTENHRHFQKGARRDEFFTSSH